MWGLQTLLCPRFRRRILAWNVLWRNSFRGFCHQSRRNIILQLLMTWFKPLPVKQISSRRSWPEASGGSTATIQNEGPVIPVEVIWFSTPEGGTAELQQDQNHVDCVFWLGRWRPSRVHPFRPKNYKEYYLNVHGLRDAIQWKWLQLWTPVTGTFITTTCLLMYQVSCRVF